VNVELVVTDLDGTLWHHDSDVHVRTRDALTRLRDAGVPVLVATGRRVRSTRAPLMDLGLAPPAVVLNGSLGLDLATGDRFHRGGFERTEARAVLDVFEQHRIDPCVYIDHDDRPVWVGPAPATHPEHLASLGADVQTGDLAAVVESELVLGFSVLGIDEDLATTLGAALRGLATPHVDRDRGYGGFSVTVAPMSQSKWDGVASFCQRHDLDASAVLAIGDGPNDAELLRNAAIAVVPEDAHPDARRHAHHVVGRARDGGWADILDFIGVSPP
jgi:HAD superfamily hydrolase (TIGR01484 family)